MKTKTILCSLFALFLFPALALAAGSATFKVTNVTSDGSVRTLTISFTGDSSTGSVPSYSTDTLKSNGDGTYTATGAGPSLTQALMGYYALVVLPENGSPAPTSGYTATLDDAAGADWWLAKIAVTTSGSPINVQSNMPIDRALTFALSGNSVASAQGTLTFYLLYAGSTKPAVQ